LFARIEIETNRRAESRIKTKSVLGPGLGDVIHTSGGKRKEGRKQEEGEREERKEVVGGAKGGRETDKRTNERTRERTREREIKRKKRRTRRRRRNRSLKGNGFLRLLLLLAHLGSGVLCDGVKEDDEGGDHEEDDRTKTCEDPHCKLDLVCLFLDHKLARHVFLLWRHVSHQSKDVG